MNRPLVHAVAALPVLRAAIRLASLERRAPLDELVTRLRRGRPLPACLRDPHLYPPIVNALLRALPPYRRLGPCVKRSLLLLEVWSRCGLAPTFHYGVGRDEDGTRRAHAWLGGVPADMPTGAPSAGFVETLEI